MKSFDGKDGCLKLIVTLPYFFQIARRKGGHFLPLRKSIDLLTNISASRAPNFTLNGGFESSFKAVLRSFSPASIKKKEEEEVH